MNYAALIEAIEEVVKTNGNKEITGANLQAVLVTMVRSLGANYTFAGVATPATSAGTPDQNVFYIGGAGTYANFGSSITIPKGSIGVFAYNGSWSNTAISVDLPTYININELVNHPAAYANAATALADVPAIYRRKGVKCVYYDDTTELWIEMLCYDDAGGENWWTDVENNWVIEGPIKTKIPSATGGQQLNIGGEKRGNLDDVLNVNVWNENIYPYDNAALARAAVPANKRKLGAIITYLLDDGWFTDQFIGNNISGWGTASNWRAVGPVSVSQNTETGKTELLIGNTTALIVDNEPEVGSHNLVESGGVAIQGIEHNSNIICGVINNYLISSTGYWTSRKNCVVRVIKITGHSQIKIKKNTQNASIISLLKSIDNIYNENLADFCTGESRRGINTNDEQTITIPNDCNYIVYQTIYDNADYCPAYLKIDGIDIITNISNLKIYIDNEINTEKTRAMGVETSLQNNIQDINEQLNGQDDISPVTSSDVLSGKYLYYDGSWRELNTARYTIIDVSAFRNLHISDLISSSVSQYAFLVSYNDSRAVFCTGTGRETGDVNNTLIPSDANYLYLYYPVTNPTLPLLHIEEATTGIMENLGANMYVAKTSNELNIYRKLAQSPYYVCYTYTHRLKSYTQDEYPSYYDNWGLTNTSVVKLTNGIITPILTTLFSAEAELAVSVTNPNGGYQYVGGGMHGFDNILTDNNGDRNLSIIIDNILIAEDAVIILKPVNRVIIQYTGNLYQAYTNTNPFSLVEKTMDYSNNGIFISNKMTLLRNMDFNAAQFGMMKLRRHYLGSSSNPYLVNKAIRNSEPYHIYTVDDAWKESGSSAGIGTLAHDATKITEYGNMGMGFSLEVIESTLKPNGGMKVWHNGGGDAKIYFDLVGSTYSASQDEILSAKVKWEIFGKPIL